MLINNTETKKKHFNWKSEKGKEGEKKQEMKKTNKKKGEVKEKRLIRKDTQQMIC